ncbi:unnamed protein product [Nesidiocoris tenuis]|uniref:Uncharacterized protein n=1 Tax=Nesidiocoris tenuis TaxID=355587 RepID=A0A6H5FWX5_9HEMI|nr:unnamed protein product [Nesidiocoris tenuis]
MQVPKVFSFAIVTVADRVICDRVIACPLVTGVASSVELLLDRLRDRHLPLHSRSIFYHPRKTSGARAPRSRACGTRRWNSPTSIFIHKLVEPLGRANSSHDYGEQVDLNSDLPRTDGYNTSICFGGLKVYFLM